MRSNTDISTVVTDKSVEYELNLNQTYRDDEWNSKSSVPEPDVVDAARPG